MSARRPSLSATTWTAIAVHIAIAWGLGHVPVAPRTALVTEAPPPDAADIDLDLGSPAPSSDFPARTVEPPATPASSPSGAAERIAARELAGSAGGAHGEGEDGLVPGPAASSAPSEGAPSSSPVLLVRPGYAGAGALGGTGAPNPFLAGTEPAPSPIAEAKERVEQALRKPARERELELGLGPDGPIRVALADAAAEGTTDITGRAVFRAYADGTGTVLGVTLVSSDGGHAGWSDAARAALRKLQGTKLRLPSAAKGAEVTVEVTSDWKLPSGHDPGVDVDVFHVPVKKGEGKKSTHVTLLDPIPKLTTVELAKDVKITIPQVQITIVGVEGDPADIGAKPRRIVHTRVVESKVL